MTTDAERAGYVVEPGPGSIEAATLVCAPVLAFARRRARFATIDAYSDYRYDMPPEVAAVQDALRVRGALRGSGDAGMDVHLDPTDERDWTLFEAYAAWSIHAGLSESGGGADDSGDDVASINDSGLSVYLPLTLDEAHELSAALPDGFSLVPLPVRVPLRERIRSAVGRRSTR